MRSPNGKADQHLRRFLALIFLISGVLCAAPAGAGEFTKNSTQPEELEDKLEVPASCAKCHAGHYRDWASSMMGNDWRDPSFLAALSIAEQDVPGVGDFCLRCHAAGWFEGKSEPPGGDFLGRAFAPAPAIDRESVPLCDMCHRLTRVGTRISRFDGRPIAEGNGSVFLSNTDPWRGGKHPLTKIHKTSELCGACHDVSSPALLSDNDDEIKHPLERTYTEWKYSFFGEMDFTCQQCHPPMKFPGAQTWLLAPGLASLYPNVDAGWAEAGYPVPADRSFFWQAARARNEQLMREAADLNVSWTDPSAPGEKAAFRVRVTNRAGHRLPTGFAEGRQMWLHVQVNDSTGRLVFEDGQLDKAGRLVRSEQTKVYEQKAAVDGEKSFHFAKLNGILKDNRIPPRGFKNEAYRKEGAFIVGAKYRDGQFWDDTPYIFDVPEDARSPLTVTAQLNYETYSKEYVDWLRETDKTLAANFGGPAAATPDRSQTWGEVTHKIWEAHAKGQPVSMAVVSSLPLEFKGGPAFGRTQLFALVALLGALGLVSGWIRNRWLRKDKPTGP